MALSYAPRTQTRASSNKKMVGLYSYTTPNVVVVGDTKLRSKMNKFEQNFNVDLVFVKAKYLPKMINEKTIAVIIDEKKVKRVAEKYLEKVLKNFKMTPVFFLARKNKKDSVHQTLYEKGVYGVIDWPEQSDNLPEILVEALKPHPKTTGKSKGDEKISEIVKTNINVDFGYKNIEVKVIDGFVFLKGRVNSAFDKKMIEAKIHDILGVKNVITKNIRIQADLTISDKELERKINMFISAKLKNEKRTLSAIVRDKRVKLMGAASEEEDLNAIKEFSEKQPGILEVINDVKLTKAVVSKNSMLAKKIEAKARNLFEGVKHISVKLYGDFAEVTGVVKVKDDKKLVERYLLQALPVKSVVNKLYITS